MSAGEPRCWRLGTPDETWRLGAAFAKALWPLQANAAWPTQRAVRLTLSGELGAGKTTWVQGFAAASGVAENISSPTYSLLQEYSARVGSLVHADFYRLANSAELDALALDDLDRPGAVWCIEWPERAAARLGEVDLALRLEIKGPVHVLRAESRSPLGEKCLVDV